MNLAWVSSFGCNCGNKGTPNVRTPAPAGNAKGNYALTGPDGTRTYYDTETAARAANQKAGGRGLVRKVQ